MPTIEVIKNELNRRAVIRPIGELQHLRKRLRPMKRLGSQVVFGDVRGMARAQGSRETSEEFPYTYHVGGRDELQFNIGIDPFGGFDLRIGVAFSFEPSRSYPTIDTLLSKVQLFNDYLRENREQFADLWMWYYSGRERSEKRRPGPLSPDMAQLHNFVFVGALARSDDPDYEWILDTLDRLLPIWRFIEENTGSKAPERPIERLLRKGRPQAASFTTATLAERLLDINLRHNVLQAALVNELIDEFGEESVGWEEAAAGGGSIDALVLFENTRTLFEIKTAATARGCVREAMGQLLDYACWPGAPEPSSLVIVGEPEADQQTTKYLEYLSRGFPVPISYRCLRVSSIV